MGRYSHWEARFKKADNSSVASVAEYINKLIRQPRSACNHPLMGFVTTFSLRGKDECEAHTALSDTSFHIKEYLEQDLMYLSKQFPDVIFSIGGHFEDEPIMYANAMNGEIEWNIPELVYPGFAKIKYE